MLTRENRLTFYFPGSWDLGQWGVNLRAISASELFLLLGQNPSLCSPLTLPCGTLLEGECPECFIHSHSATLTRLLCQAATPAVLRLLGKLLMGTPRPLRMTTLFMPSAHQPWRQRGDSTQCEITLHLLFVVAI